MSMTGSERDELNNSFANMLEFESSEVKRLRDHIKFIKSDDETIHAIWYDVDTNPEEKSKFVGFEISSIANMNTSTYNARTIIISEDEYLFDTNYYDDMNNINKFACQILQNLLCDDDFRCNNRITLKYIDNVNDAIDAFAKKIDDQFMYCYKNLDSRKSSSPLTSCICNLVDLIRYTDQVMLSINNFHMHYFASIRTRVCDLIKNDEFDKLNILLINFFTWRKRYFNSFNLTDDEVANVIHFVLKNCDWMNELSNDCLNFMKDFLHKHHMDIAGCNGIVTDSVDYYPVCEIDMEDDDCIDECEVDMDNVPSETEEISPEERTLTASDIDNLLWSEYNGHIHSDVDDTMYEDVFNIRPGNYPALMISDKSIPIIIDMPIPFDTELVSWIYTTNGNYKCGNPNCNAFIRHGCDYDNKTHTSFHECPVCGLPKFVTFAVRHPVIKFSNDEDMTDEGSKTNDDDNKRKYKLTKHMDPFSLNKNKS